MKHNVVTKNMLIASKNLRKVKLQFSPLTYNPIAPRLDHMRQMIFFSDYMQAEKLLLPLIKDVRDCIDNRFGVF